MAVGDYRSRYGSRMATTEQDARPDPATMEEIVALCKRRGFVFPSSEIYGGLGSTYDYGHYGVLLKNNVKAEWWRAMLQERDDIVALDSAVLQHPRAWEAPGHRKKRRRAAGGGRAGRPPRPAPRPLDSAILQHPRVWEASGHLEGFTDPLVDCKTCGQRFCGAHLHQPQCHPKPP